MSSGILTLAAKYGGKVVVLTLTGNEGAASATSEIVAALLEGESRLEQQLDSIQVQLEEVLDQRFLVELEAGTRFLRDSLRSLPRPPINDLQLAQEHLTLAVSAGRSELQRARAQRLLVLTYLLMGRIDLVGDAIPELESDALMAGLTAIHDTGSDRTTLALMRRDGLSATGRGSAERKRAAARRAIDLAFEQRSLCRVLLAEAAVLANELGMPERFVDRAVMLDDPSSLAHRGWLVPVPPEGSRYGPVTAQYRWKGGDARGTRTPQPPDAEMYQGVLELTLEPPFKQTVRVSTSEGAPVLVHPGTVSVSIHIPAGQHTVVIALPHELRDLPGQVVGGVMFTSPDADEALLMRHAPWLAQWDRP
jgi:hypothetical protein